MSAPMKAPRTKGVQVTISNKRFVVPPRRAIALVTLLSEYRVRQRAASKDSIPASEVFADLNAKYGGRVASVIRGFRVRDELTQVDLAEKIHIAQADLSKIENGTRRVGKKLAMRLAKVFRTNYRVFLE